MLFCKYARTYRDESGKLEFYCVKLDWRMDMEMLARCRQCHQYSQA